MATFTKINDFVKDLLNGVHNLSSGTIKLALTNTAPASEASNPTTDTHGVLASLTQISYTNISGGQPVLGTVTVSLSSGTVTFDAADEVITASGGSVGPFRYIYVYNDTPTSPADPLIGLWDYGSSLTLADGESLTVQFAGTGILTLA